MAAYVIFIKERTHNQGELDLYMGASVAEIPGGEWHSLVFQAPGGSRSGGKSGSLRAAT